HKWEGIRESGCFSRLIHMHKWEGIRESGCSLQKDGKRCVKCAYLCIPWYLQKLPDESASLICVRILRLIKAGLNQVCSICNETRGVLAYQLLNENYVPARNLKNTNIRNLIFL